MLWKFNSLFNHNKEFRWTIKLNFQNVNKAFKSQKLWRWKYLQSWFSWLCLDFRLWLRFQFLVICQFGSYFMLRMYLTWILIEEWRMALMIVCPIIVSEHEYNVMVTYIFHFNVMHYCFNGFIFFFFLLEKHVFKPPQPKRPKSLRIYESHIRISSTSFSFFMWYQ